MLPLIVTVLMAFPCIVLLSSKTHLPTNKSQETSRTEVSEHLGCPFFYGQWIWRCVGQQHIVKGREQELQQETLFAICELMWIGRKKVGVVKIE